MAYEENDLSLTVYHLDETDRFYRFNKMNDSTNPTEPVIIAFHIGRIISILCVVFGTFGNVTLIIIIRRSTFRHFPYGLLLLFISIFDIIRLISITLYYLLHAMIIPLTLGTVAVTTTLYRYPKIVTNWLKVFLAIDRYIAVKYWIRHRYNIHSNHSKQINRSRQKKLMFLILVLLLCSIISQHPNAIPIRYSSTWIDPARLLIINTPNRNFYYGNSVFNGVLYTAISYIILDDFLPISLLIICNTFLLYEIRHLPSVTSKKLADSIFILFFLTIFSIFVIPRSFLVLFNLYVNQEYINVIIIAIASHTCQGLEMINHAITGYACFLSCRALRKELIKSIHAILKKFNPEKTTGELPPLELQTITQER